MLCRILVITDTFVNNSVPHISLSALDKCDKYDNSLAINRENEYKDFSGLLVEKDKVSLDKDDIKRSEILVKELGKSIVYLVRGEYLAGWLFYQRDSKVEHKKVKAHTVNNVNFDVWFEEQNSLWNPVDFLLEGSSLSINGYVHNDMEEDDEDDEYVDDIDIFMSNVLVALDNIEGKLEKIMNKINLGEK